MTLKGKKTKLKIKKYFFEFLQMIVGTFLMAVAVSLFLLPSLTVISYNKSHIVAYVAKATEDTFFNFIAIVRAFMLDTVTE